jgi:acetyl-CoA carboxylase biotin carboxyl carrier protein
MSDEKAKKGRPGWITRAIKGENVPDVDPDLIRELSALLTETGLTEIEIERAGVRVRVARNAAPMIAAAVPMAAPSGATAPATATPAAEAKEKRGTIVTSPMVGTVYLAPQPGAAPFVKLGDRVKDETLLIIEAMKTMNPVPAPVSGQIAEIYVRDGQPVEFGEPLMRIE